MPCEVTEPIRIQGDGTGELVVRYDVWPPNPCKCGQLRIETEILYIADENPAGEVVATIRFKVNSDHYEFIRIGNIILGTGYDVAFVLECEEDSVIFAWRLHMTDDAETYAVGDLWWWEHIPT